MHSMYHTHAVCTHEKEGNFGGEIVEPQVQAL